MIFWFLSGQLCPVELSMLQSCQILASLFVYIFYVKKKKFCGILSVFKILKTSFVVKSIYYVKLYYFMVFILKSCLKIYSFLNITNIITY